MGLAGLPAQERIAQFDHAEYAMNIQRMIGEHPNDPGALLSAITLATTAAPTNALSNLCRENLASLAANHMPDAQLHVLSLPPRSACE